mmetsp:Transcript_80051/g.158582  ORF Transcript_80051/g.158582 Transcript_80051/m.158582 type:complete len:796 (+) Transcript_80051:176-2563(+)
MAGTARKTPLAFGILLLLLRLGHAVASRLNRSRIHGIQNLGRHSRHDPWDDSRQQSLQHMQFHDGHKLDSTEPLGIEHLNRTLYSIINSAHSFQNQRKPPDGALKEAIGLLDAMVLELLSRLQSMSKDQREQIERDCSSVKVCGREFQAAKTIVAQKKMAFESILTQHTTCRTEEVKVKKTVIQCKAMVFVSKQLSESTCKALSDFEESAGNDRTHVQVVTRAPGESVKDYLNRMTTHFCGEGGGGRGRRDGGCNGILCRYTEKDQQCTDAKVRLTSVTRNCNKKTQSYNSRKISCNGAQTRMDTAACTYAHFSKQTCDNYKKCHSQTIKQYLVLKAGARESEESRKKQWRILMRMRCMLKVLQKDGCKPNDKALAECKSKPKDDYNPEHLDLKFKCNLEAQLCTKATVYPGSDAYKTLLANLPKDAPAREPAACGGLGVGVGELVKGKMLAGAGAGDMVGDANRGLTEEVYLFPQKCDYPDLRARRPTLVRGVRRMKFPPWPDTNHDAFAARFTGYVQIKKPGEYKFWTVSPAGSAVYIDEKKVYQVRLCRDKHGKGDKKPEKISLKAGFAKLRVDVYANARPGKLELKYQGLDTFGATTDVPANVLWKMAPSPLMMRAHRHGEKKFAPVTGTCTCGFTVHTHLFSVYVDGIDMTSKVKGDKNTWDEKKTLHFPCGADTLLAISGADSDKGCKTGGFAMMCTSSDSKSPWHKYIADKTWKVFASMCADGRCSAHNKRILKMPHGWYLPAFDDSRWPHASKGESDKAQVVAGTPFDICGSTGPAWLFRSNVRAAL